MRVNLTYTVFTFATLNRYAMVSFPTQADAIDALIEAEKEELECDGFRLVVNRAPRDPIITGKRKLHVSNT